MSDIEDMAGLEEEEDEVNTSAFPRKNLLEAFGTPSKTTTDASSNVDVSSRDHSDHMKVYLRIRPFTTEETEKSENQVCLVYIIKNYILKTLNYISMCNIEKF